MIKVIGAGLAGCEAAWHIANQGIAVKLYEMRPNKMTEAHKTSNFAELVCSNSLRAEGMKNAVGVLKYEMKMLNSIIIDTAESTRVKAGGALAVDREGFSESVTKRIKEHPLIEVIEEEVITFNEEDITIIATGPLTSEALSDSIKNYIDEDSFYFFDAAAPIIEASSINMNVCYLKSRYDKGEAAYINCPMNAEEFDRFYEALITAECVTPKDFELKVFEGCMPAEVMAKRGKQTLLFGPMKPVGLEKEGEKRPHAVVQLRQDNVSASLYNIVGFQTHLKWPEQKRVVQLIPGLEEAKIVRYGVIHKNNYINSPKVLLPTYQSKKSKNLFFAGQITGVEGYVESAASGILAGINAVRLYRNQQLIEFPRETILGSMAYYITHADPKMFQPMNANFGIVAELEFSHKKKDRKQLYGERALEVMTKTLQERGMKIYESNVEHLD